MQELELFIWRLFSWVWDFEANAKLCGLTAATQHVLYQFHHKFHHMFHHVSPIRLFNDTCGPSPFRHWFQAGGVFDHQKRWQVDHLGTDDPHKPHRGGAIPAGSAPRSPGKSGFLGRPAIPMVPEANNKCNWRPLFGAQKSYRNFWFTEIQRDVNVFAWFCRCTPTYVLYFYVIWVICIPIDVFCPNLSIRWLFYLYTFLLRVELCRCTCTLWEILQVLSARLGAKQPNLLALNDPWPLDCHGRQQATPKGRPWAKGRFGPVPQSNHMLTTPRTYSIYWIWQGLSTCRPLSFSGSCNVPALTNGTHSFYRKMAHTKWIELVYNII